MKKNLKNSFQDIDDFFASPPTINQRAWGIIHDFYHEILTYMEKNNLNKAGLAKKLNKSRSAISQMFNKTPNITIKKMVEISDTLGLDLKIEVVERDILPAKFLFADANNVVSFYPRPKDIGIETLTSESGIMVDKYTNVSSDAPTLASQDFLKDRYNKKVANLSAWR